MLWSVGSTTNFDVLCLKISYVEPFWSVAEAAVDMLKNPDPLPFKLDADPVFGLPAPVKPFKFNVWSIELLRYNFNDPLSAFPKESVE